MKLALRFLCSVTLLLILAHRLPAPISEPTPEETKAKPQAAPAKHKTVESSDSNSTRRFDGTWKGTLVDKTTSAGAVYTSSATLIIRDGKTADVTAETTCILHDPRGWSLLPEAHRHLSPLYFKRTNHSDHLVADGFDLIIRWSGAGRRLVDWAPKTLTLEEAQKFAGMDKPADNAVVFTVKGDELVVGNSKFVYHRVK